MCMPFIQYTALQEYITYQHYLGRQLEVHELTSVLLSDSHGPPKVACILLHMHIIDLYRIALYFRGA